MRAFLAITLPESIQSLVAESISPLQKQFPQVSWESEYKLHLTLAFFKQIEHDELKVVSDVVNQTVRKYEPFPLTIGNLSYFYKKHGDSILYFDVQDKTNNLHKLYRDLTDQLYGKVQDLPRRLSLHITLGRVNKAYLRLKRMRQVYELKHLLFDIKKTETSINTSFDVHSLDFYESTYNQYTDTSAYHLFRSFPLNQDHFK